MKQLWNSFVPGVKDDSQEFGPAARRIFLLRVVAPNVKPVERRRSKEDTADLLLLLRRHWPCV